MMMTLEERRRMAQALRAGPERRSFSVSGLELRDAGNGTVKLSGYASVTETPYEVGWYEETIARGAFRATLAAGPDVALVVNHAVGGQLPLARTTSGTLRLTEDRRGLKVDADLDADDPDVMSLRRKMRRGDISAMSFAFLPARSEWDDEFTKRRVVEADLDGGDVSVVNNGANPAAGAEMRRGFPGPAVRSEPLTYRRDNRHQVSYFRDLLLAPIGSQEGHQAQARLDRHDREMRAAPNREPGQGGHFSPPLWLLEEFASVSRPGRVLSRLVPSLPLPPGVGSVNLPRITAGASVQHTQDGAPTSSTDIADAGLRSPAMPVSGHQVVSLQLYEQSPRDTGIDFAVFMDLEEAYAASLESFLLAGSGQGGQVLGIATLEGTNDVVYTDASPTAAEMVPALRKAAARIGRLRLRPLEAWLLRSDRWAWLAAAGLAPSILTVEEGGDGRIGKLLGWPAYCDDAIPATLGGGDDEDIVIGCRPSDLRLWEGGPRTHVDLQSLSGTLQARLTLTRTAAFIPDRYPSGVSVISGTGMVPETDA